MNWFKKTKYIPVQHYLAYWIDEKGDRTETLSYTIFYNSKNHEVSLVKRGSNADTHNVYHRRALRTLYVLRKLLLELSIEQMIDYIKTIEINNYVDDSKKKVLETPDAIKKAIKESLNKEDYKEVERLQKKLDQLDEK